MDILPGDKRVIALLQNEKCANYVDSNYPGLEGYQCPLWKADQDGSFDEAGYEIDLLKGDCTNRENMRALCRSCYHVITTRQVGEKSSVIRPPSLLTPPSSPDGEEDIRQKFGDPYDPCSTPSPDGTSQSRSPLG